MKKALLSAVVATSIVGGTTAVADTQQTSPEQRFMPASMADAAGMQVVDPIELNSTRAGLAPLAAFAFGVASLDLALIGAYWGIYVPYYAPQEPAYNMP